MNLPGFLVPLSLAEKQALRMRRFGFAALGYAVAGIAGILCWRIGIVDRPALLWTMGAAVVLNLALFAAFRSGFNLRFADPSLTLFQTLAAITLLMQFVYQMGSGRYVALLPCFLIFLFGILRLGVRQLALIALYILVSYALVIVLLMAWRPEAIEDAPLEWLTWLIFAAILPCFAVVGGQVDALRLSLRRREAHFRSLTQLSSDFYWETDAEHRLLAVAHGPQHRAVLSRSRQVGERRWDIPSIHPDEAGWAAHRATLDARQSFRSFELGRLGPDREERHLSISGEPMFDDDGRFTGYRGVGRDITARKRAEHLLGLEHAVARCMSEADSAAAGIEAVIQAICESEKWEVGRYWRVDEAAGLLRFSGCWGAPGPDRELAQGDSQDVVFARGAGVVGSVWEIGQPVWIADTMNDPRVVRKNLVRSNGTRGVLAFPVASEGRIIGVLSISSLEVRKPDEKLLATVNVIGGQVGQFLLRKQAEQALAQQAARQGLIATFGQQALSSADRDELFRQAMAVAMHGLDAGFCLMLQEGHDGAPRVLAAEGWGEVPSLYGAGDAFAAARYDFLLASREPVVINDYALESRFALPALLASHKIRSSVEVSVGSAAAKLGVLGVYAVEPRHFTTDSANFLQSVANILATAIGRRNAEERLVQMAQFDALTGLPNRSLFLELFARTLAQSARDQCLAAIMFVDLDRFKAVNDRLGHAIGDQLLIETTQRLHACVGPADLVARLGGDEFAIVLSNLADAAAATPVAQRVIGAMERAFMLEGHEVYVSASVGICVYPEGGADVDVLVKNADSAMYRAKERGRNTWQYYLPQMSESALARLEMETRLRGALERNEFTLHYQPKADLATGGICGFEALLRWQPAGQDLVMPDQFIPILEDTGLIVPVGEWVIRTVCEQLACWREAGVALRPVAVNLSARQFHQRDLDVAIGDILQAAGIDPRLLEFELTESMLMSDPDAAVLTLKNLRTYGVRLSVDDFGTGYSSLSHLKRFPLDALKIDRAFVRDVTIDADDATISVAIISLAHSLSLTVVAEGVETAAQLDFLRSHGCDEMQGYYFARPLTVADCTQALNEGWRLPGHDTAVRRGGQEMRVVGG